MAVRRDVRFLLERNTDYRGGGADLRRAQRFAARAEDGRKLAREFQGHVDELVREAELDELRDKARSLTSQSLSQHIEKIVDPDRELVDLLSAPAIAEAESTAAENIHGG